VPEDSLSASLHPRPHVALSVLQREVALPQKRQFLACPLPLQPFLIRREVADLGAGLQPLDSDRVQTAPERQGFGDLKVGKQKSCGTRKNQSCLALENEAEPVIRLRAIIKWQ